MTRSKLFLGAFLVVAVAACGPTQIVVTAESDGGDGQATRPLGDLEIRVVPYDRDLIFDSMTAAASQPEPAIPDSVLAAQDQVAAAQQAWRDTEVRWNVLRDTLQTLSESLEQMSRAQAQYRLLFRDFQDLEDEYNTVERRRDVSFRNFTALQESSFAAAEQIRLVRVQWGDEAFADVGAVMLAHERASGLTTMYDTTDATGSADGFEARPGDYWVTARYELPYTELYWNVPVTVVKGDPVQVRLTLSNASSRTKL